MYAITATITRKRGGWSSTRQIPTFYLDERVQGIVSEDHAARIAHSIVLPFTDSPYLTADVTAVRVD